MAYWRDIQGWLKLAQIIVQWTSLVSTAITLWMPERRGNLLGAWTAQRLLATLRTSVGTNSSGAFVCCCRTDEFGNSVQIAVEDFHTHTHTHTFLRTIATNLQSIFLEMFFKLGHLKSTSLERLSIRTFMFTSHRAHRSMPTLCVLFIFISFLTENTASFNYKQPISARY
jgi:hypothetical protein